MVKQLSEMTLYRWRYRLGYLIVCLAGLGLLALALFYTPGGISQREMQSVITTSSLSFSAVDSQSVINAPYHVLQWLSIRTFGLSDFSIKLPSVVIGVLTTIGVVGLLSYWFRRNVAVLTAIIVVTTGQFLFVTQDGTPEIMTLFWAVWILFAALMVSRNAQFLTLWKVIMFGAMALSLYTPFSFYMLIAILSAALLHPHLRYIVRQMSTIKVGIALLFATGIIAPLAFAVSNDPTIIRTMLGIPSQLPDALVNLRALGHQYIDFVHASSGLTMTPIYGLGSILLILLGLLRLFTTKYTARGYILTAWLVLLIPIVFLNPSAVNVTFVPFILLIAMGVELLFSRWYRLFPRNPYARLAGLLPLSVLLGGMVISGVVRYVDGYTYNPAMSNNFSQDLRLVNQQLAEGKKESLAIVTESKNVPFYSVLAKYDSRVKVSSEVPTAVTQSTLIAGTLTQPVNQPPSRILTDRGAKDSDRFYLYKNSAK